MFSLPSAPSVDGLLDWNDDIDELVLFSLMTVGTAYLLVISFQYGSDARFVPIIVLSVLLVLLVLKLGVILSEMFGVDFLGWVLPGSGTEDGDSGHEDEESQSIYSRIQSATGEEGPPPVSYQVRQIVWMLGFTVVMYLVGILIAIPLLLFTFIAITSDFPIHKNLVYTLVVWGLIYGIFFIVLGVSRYGGILF